MSDMLRPSGIALKSARLLGVELAFVKDTRGRVWVPLSPGSHLIYGRNGSGKSTLLRALLAALSGDTSEDDLGFQVRLFVEISDKPIGVETVEFVDDDDSDDETDVVTSEVRIDRSIIVEEISKGEWWSDPYTPAIDNETEFAEIIKWLSGDDVVLDEVPIGSLWNEQLGVSLTQARTAWLAYHLQSNKLWDEEGSDREGWNDARDLIREAASQEVYCLRPRGSGRWALSCAVSTESAVASRVVDYIRRDYKRKHAEFHRDRLGWSDDQISTGATHESFEDESCESEFLGHLGPIAALISWDAPPSTQWSEHQQISPYLEIQDWRSNPIIEWPWLFGRSFSDRKADVAIVDLNAPVNLDDWNRRHVSDAFSSYSSQSWNFSISRDVLESHSMMARVAGDTLEPEHEVTFVDRAENKSDFRSSGLLEYQLLLDQVAADAARFGIGIDGVRYKLSDDVKKWLFGEGCSLEVRSQVTGSWFPIVGLSPAQRAVLTVLLKVRDAREKGDVVLCLGDEIDAGLHVSALRTLYRYLKEECDVAYLSSHSPVVLSLPDHRRLLVRNSTGRPVEILEWKPDPDFTAASEVLGVDKSHLLSAVTCWVIVEGEHDIAAFSALLDDPTDYTSSIRILPARGHMNTHNVLNCEAIFNYSDVPIVVVLDGASEIDFLNLQAKVRELSREGFSGRIIVDKLIRPISKAGLKPETQTLLSILTGAIGSERHKRLHLIGLKERDIIQYLPPSQLGLSGTWESLFTEYRATSSTLTFKDWLRQHHSVQISAKLIKEWFTNLDQVPPDLARAVSTIFALSRGEHLA